MFTAATMLLHAQPFRGTDIQHADDIKARLVAEHLLRYLKQSSYVIMNGSPRQEHSTPKMCDEPSREIHRRVALHAGVSVLPPVYGEIN